MTKLLLTVLLLPLFGSAQTATGVIIGRILNPNGLPAAGVRVSAMAQPQANVPSSSTMTLMSLAQTDGDGRYRLENIPPGRYLIAAGLLESPTYYPGTLGVERATVLTVASGGSVTAADFTLLAPAGVTVSGRVSLSAGQTAPFLLLTMTPSARVPLQAVVNSDGSFQFEKVIPGTYLLQLQMNFGFLLVKAITVGNNDVVDVDIVLPATKEVKGRVFIEGQPRTSLTLNFYLGNIVPNNTPTTLPDGTFTLTFPEGERLVKLNVPGYSVRSLTYGETNLLVNSLRITVADEAELEVMLAANPTTVPKPETAGPDWPLRARTAIVSIRTEGQVEDQGPYCLSCPSPEYPHLARTARVSGAVVLLVAIRADGRVAQTQTLAGHELLQAAAMSAVRIWRFKPRTVDGNPVEHTVVVTVTFDLK